MYHVFLDNVTSQAIGDGGVKLNASIYAGDAGRVEIAIAITRDKVVVICLNSPDVVPYISVDAQVLYAARLFGKLLP